MPKSYANRIFAGKYKIESAKTENKSLAFYIGREIVTRKPVFIKVFQTNLADEKIQEIRKFARLSHPNAVNLIDYGRENDGEFFLIFEMPEGETLKELIAKGRTFTLEEANKIIQQIASALIAAHANGVFHGHLNDENVFVSTTPDGRIFVKVFGFNEFENAMNAYDAIFMAPEQLSIDRTKDERVDVYALGVIAYKLLTGVLPFSGGTLEEVKEKSLKESPISILAFRDDASDELKAVIERALAKSPDNRFQTVKGFAESFDFAVRFTGKAIGSLVTTAAATNVSKNNPWRTAFIVLVGMILLGGLFIYLTQVKQVDPLMVLPTDTNALPVQPISPATGLSEQSLSNMNGYEDPSKMKNLANNKPEVIRNTGPWEREVLLPPPSNQYYDGSVNPNSPFMPTDGNVYILVPKNTSTNVKTNRSLSTDVPQPNTQQMQSLKQTTSSATELQKEDKLLQQPAPSPNASPN